MITEKLPDVGRGNTLEAIPIEFFNDDGTVYDMTDAGAFVQFRLGGADGTVVADLSVGSGLTWTSIATGKLQIDQIDELDWKIATYYYDVRVKELAYPLYTPIGGTMKVVKIVTKRKV